MGATSRPFRREQFPTVDGIQGESIIVGHRASFYYDTRDSLVTPTDGMSVMAYAELNQNVKNGDHPVYSRYELEIRSCSPANPSVPFWS